jgi:alpha-beta hydrolase superfamily lysophospholipase
MDSGSRAGRLRSRYEPAPALGALRLPVLLLYGGDDNLVPATSNIALWRRLAPEAIIDAREYPGIDHALLRSTEARARIGISADSQWLGLEAYLDLVNWLAER